MTTTAKTSLVDWHRDHFPFTKNWQGNPFSNEPVIANRIAGIYDQRGIFPISAKLAEGLGTYKMPNRQYFTKSQAPCCTYYPAYDSRKNSVSYEPYFISGEI